MAHANWGIVWIFCERFLAGLQRFGQVLCRTIGVHDEEAGAAVFFVAKMAQLVERKNRGLIVLAVFVKLAELLVQNGEGASAGRQHCRLALYARDGVGQNANGVVVAALGLIQHGLVVHNLEIAGGVLPRFEQAFFSAIELVHFAIDLRDAEVDVGIVGHYVSQLLINGQRLGELLFRHQRLTETTLVAELGGIQLRGFAIGLFGLGQIFRLRIGVTEKIEQQRRRGAVGHAFE